MEQIYKHFWKIDRKLGKIYKNTSSPISGVIFAGNSISIISIFLIAYIDIIDIISIFSKSSNHPKTWTIYYWNWTDNTVRIKIKNFVTR